MEQELQQLKRELESVKEEAGRLRDELRNLQTYGSQINTNLDNRSQDSFQREFTPSFRNQLRQEIFDSVWNDHFYYYTPFEGMDGWNIFQGSPVVANNGLRLSAAPGSPSGAGKNVPPVLSPVSFDAESKFRTALFLTLGITANDMEYGLSVGTCTNLKPNGKHYGFLVLNGVLYGTVGDGLNAKRIPLLTLRSDGLESYPRLLEAHYYPNDRVDFYVSTLRNEGKADEQIRTKGSADVDLRLMGTIKENLPQGAMTDGWILFQLYSTNGAKAADVPSVEYIQKKNW